MRHSPPLLVLDFPESSQLHHNREGESADSNAGGRYAIVFSFFFFFS